MFTLGGGVWMQSCLLLVAKGQCLSTVSLCLEQSQVPYLLGNDKSGMALKNLPFYTNQK